jgi:thiol:disulfide interchange protein
MLASLPRAGSWMVWIKKGFGIGMLVVGAWFLYETLTMLFPAVLPRLSA